MTFQAEVIIGTTPDGVSDSIIRRENHKNLNTPGDIESKKRIAYSPINISFIITAGSFLSTTLYEIYI
jgi:hypothetical protein